MLKEFIGQHDGVKSSRGGRYCFTGVEALRTMSVADFNMRLPTIGMHPTKKDRLCIGAELVPAIRLAFIRGILATQNRFRPC